MLSDEAQKRLSDAMARRVMRGLSPVCGDQARDTLREYQLAARQMLDAYRQALADSWVRK